MPRQQPEPPTLAALCDRIAADERLLPRQRQDLVSGLRTIGKAIRQPLENISAHPGVLRERLKGFAPAMAGVSPRRWRNVLSLARFALKHAGLAHVPGRYREPLAPEWGALLAQLKSAQARFGLSRLGRYCSVQGIHPAQVDDGVLEIFLGDLLGAGLIGKPREVHRTACRVWNQAAATIPGWPPQQLTVPDYRRMYALPWSTFPASLEADLQSYLDRLAGRDILAELDFRPLKSLSIATRTRQLHEFLSAAVHHGRDPATLRTLADAVALDVVKDGLRFLLGRIGDRETSPHVHAIAGVITAVARHWVRVDAGHLAALQALCRRLDPGQRGMAERNRDRLHQFDDPDKVRALIRLPQTIFAEARKAPTLTRALARKVQTALAIELLLMVSLRIHNLASLCLGRHLIRSGRDVMHLSIRAEEVKNNNAIEGILPPETVRLIDFYEAKCLPLLRSNTGRSWLFPGRSEGPKSTDMLREQITTCVRQRCGLEMHPHLFRHFAAKVMLTAEPGAYGVVRLLHGHKSVDTTTRILLRNGNRGRDPALR